MNPKAETSLKRILPRLESRFASADPSEWKVFRTRVEDNFENLFERLLHLYGDQYDFFYHLESILEMAARMWMARPAELKELDARREEVSA